LEAQLSQLSRGDRDSSQLDAFLFAVQCLLSLGLYGDDPSGPEYLELEVGVAGDGHECDKAWPPQDDMIRPREVDHLEREHFGAVVACISKSDRQGDLPQGDGLLAQDHYIEWVRVALEMIPGKP
jgi:hypothetical protein